MSTNNVVPLCFQISATIPLPIESSHDLPAVESRSLTRLEKFACNRAVPCPLEISSKLKNKIYERQKDLLTALNHRISIIVSGTGCGKTTTIPIIICEQNEASKVICILPTRVTTRETATFVMNNTHNGVFGYAIRKDPNWGSNTRVLYATVGIALNILSRNAANSVITHVIVDDCHVRPSSVLRILEILKNAPNIKIVFTTATLTDNFKEKIQNYFNEIPYEKRVKYSSQYKIKNINPAKFLETKELGSSVMSNGDKWNSQILNEFVKELCEIMLKKNNKNNNIIVFVAGLSEMRRLRHTIKKIKENKNIHVFMFHSSIKNNNAFKKPIENGFKLFIGTDCIENGITLPDVSIVVDCCEQKRLTGYNSDGFVILEKQKNSWITMQQRRGRTGRTRRGYYIPLCNSSDYDDMLKRHHRDQVTQEVFIHKYAISDIDWNHTRRNLSDMFDALKPNTINQLDNTLHELGIIDLSAGNKVTAVGSLTNLISCVEPELALLVLFGRIFGNLSSMITVAAVNSTHVGIVKHSTDFAGYYDKEKAFPSDHFLQYLALEDYNWIDSNQKLSAETKHKMKKHFNETTSDDMMHTYNAICSALVYSGICRDQNWKQYDRNDDSDEMFALCVTMAFGNRFVISHDNKSFETKNQLSLGDKNEFSVCSEYNYTLNGSYIGVYYSLRSSNNTKIGPITFVRPSFFAYFANILGTNGKNGRFCDSNGRLIVHFEGPQIAEFRQKLANQIMKALDGIRNGRNCFLNFNMDECKKLYAHTKI